MSNVCSNIETEPRLQESLNPKNIEKLHAMLIALAINTEKTRTKIINIKRELKNG